jgi:DNA-binding CsgD family transcriptional regulator
MRDWLHNQEFSSRAEVQNAVTTPTASLRHRLTSRCSELMLSPSAVPALRPDRICGQSPMSQRVAATLVDVLFLPVKQARAVVAELEEALSLTGDIYDAALDPDCWPETLRKICGFVGGVATALVSHDVPAGTSEFYYVWGDRPDETRSYREKYARLNPIAVPMLLLEVGDVRSASQMISRERLWATRFYKEWLSLTGYGDNTFAVIDKSSTVVTYLATVYEGRVWPASPESRGRTALIVPHVRRAVAIGNVVRRHRIDAETLADAVDALDAGVFLVRGDGHLVRANASGRAMLAAGSMVCLDQGTLNACGASARRSLRETIAAAIAGEFAVGPRGVAVPLTTGDNQRFVAHVLPLNSGTRRKAGLSYRAGAAVFVHKAAIEGLLPIEALARAFDLSAAELRVLVAVVEVGGHVPDVASVLGLSGPTVRTHLRRLFEKTKSKGQTDLVKVVAGYSNPLIGKG